MNKYFQKRIALYPIMLAICLMLAIAISPDLRSILIMKLNRHAVGSRVKEYQSTVIPALSQNFHSARIEFPSARNTLVFSKDQKILELYSGNATGPMKLIKTFHAKAASGKAGPKLAEGDCQVPEGIYKIESLNPNSTYHLALRLNYPNAFDQQKARIDDRKNLGGDIMIHGDAGSIGCIALENSAIEELFVLNALTKPSTWKVIIMPTDLRKHDRADKDTDPAWISELDANIKAELSDIR